MEAGEVMEIKMQLAFLISRHVETEKISGEEKQEILEILNEVKKGEYATKESLGFFTVTSIIIWAAAICGSLGAVTKLVYDWTHNFQG